MSGSEQRRHIHNDQPPLTRQVLLNQLLPQLDARVLAYALGRSTTAGLRAPMTSAQQEEDWARLQLLSAIVDRLWEPYDVAAAWLVGLNQGLGDVSPLRLLRARGATAAAELVVAAGEHRR